MKNLENILLSPYTTLGVGGKARYFTQVSTVGDLILALEFADRQALDVFILGEGSNILVSDEGFSGLVIKVSIKGIETVQENDFDQMLRVGAGENWDEFVLFCVNNNLWGVECLSGIPGLVGASPIQNVGAYGLEVADTIVKVETIDRDTLKKREFGNEECQFSYRNSRFKKEEKYVVTHVTFKLSKKPSPTLTYEPLKTHFANSNPTLKAIRQKVLEIRKIKGMVYDEDDSNTHSTGSFFVNPVISRTQLKKLLKTHPKIPHWEIDEENVKISAAWLIENAGFKKGYKYKTAALSEKHTLAMVNNGNAKASDIYEFAQLVKEKVSEEFGIELERETQLVGYFN